MSDYPFPWGPPPEGYVPGLGRGETGFVSYIENAVVEIQDEKDKVSEKTKIKEEKADNAADDFYRTLEEKIASRNKKRTKRNSKKSEEKTIFDEVRDQFADLSLTLKNVKANDWENIPDIGSTKNYRPKWELLTYASDRMVTGDFSESSLMKEDRLQDVLGTKSTDLEDEKEMMAVSRARTSVMKTMLSKQVRKYTIDTSEYQHELNVEMERRLEGFSSLDEAASLYKKMTRNNKEDPVNWILRARIEERLGHYDVAKKVARDGLSYNLENEDLVLEAARLSPANEAQVILEASIKKNHQHSEKVWMTLAALQPNEMATNAVLERAIKFLPDKPEVWKVASQHNEEQALDILKEGLKYNEGSETLIAEGFLKSSTQEEIEFFNSQVKVESIELLIAKAKAEERCSFDVEETIRKMLSLDENKDWILEAETLEREGFVKIPTFISNTIKYSSEFVNRAQEAEKVDCPIVAEQLLRRVSATENQWMPLLSFLKRKGALQETIEDALDKYMDNPLTVIQICDFLDDESSCSVFKFALSKSPKSEKLVIAYTNRLIQSGQKEAATGIAKEKSIELHSAELYTFYESVLGKDADIDIFYTGVKLFPNEPNMWLRLASRLQGKEKGKVLQTAVTKCPNVGIIHIEFIRAAKENGILPQQIRALFEKACNQCKDDEIVWLMASENEPIEHKVALLETAKKFVKRPEIIWARQIELYPPEQRLLQCDLAIQAIGEKRELLLLKGLCEWRRSEIDKARSTFKKVTEQSPQWGDGWAYRLRFEQEQGSERELAEVQHDVESCDIKSGFTWEAARADPEFISLGKEALLSVISSEIPDPNLVDSSIFGNILNL